MKFGFVAVFRSENEVGIDDNISVGHKCQSAEFLMEYENMNRQEEYQSDGDAAMKDQNDGELVQDHSEQAGGEGDHNQCMQQPSFCTQFLSVSNGMDDAQQQKQDRCQLMDMYTGQRYHDGYDEAD